MAKELRQFQCKTCPGKFSSHPFKVWYERVPVTENGDAGTSQCHICKNHKQPVPRGEELYVHICHFSCSNGHQLRQYTVRCKMSDTAPCYAPDCEAQVSPHSFSPLRRIKKCTDNVHNCSECNGEPDCPNMMAQPHKRGAANIIPSVPAAIMIKELVKQEGATANSQCG